MKHVITSLKVQKTEIIIIHVCGNDINSKNKDNVNVNKRADNIISLALCRDSGVSDVVIQNFCQRRVLWQLLL